MVNYDKLQEQLKAKGLSQSFISEKIGMSRNYLKDCKRLRTDIPSDRLSMISEMLGTTPAYLRDEEASMVYKALKSFEANTADAWDAIAKATDVEVSQAANWCKGISNGYMEHIPALANLLEIPEDVLIGKVSKHKEPSFQAFVLFEAFQRASADIQTAVLRLLDISIS